MRPITIVALHESDENVRFIMDSVINTETSIIEETGLDLTRGKAQVEIIRSQFDTKMAKLLSGSGGAHCQLCTATFAQAHDIDFARDGFPINRFIHDAKIFFEEVGEEQFRTLSSDQRFNLTNPPTSDKDILSASPLHAYLRSFSWFLTLISHLQTGHTHRWAPSSKKVTDARKLITSLIDEKLNISIDQPSAQGGTSTTGNIVRQCFRRGDDDKEDFLYWILTFVPSEAKTHVATIYNNLGAILRVLNSSRKIDTRLLETVCKETYEIIIQHFPWANISPTVHKVLAHTPQVINEYNDGFGLENLSEEGLEASNKLIRRYRERLSRKFCFEDELSDIFIRLLSQSDPILGSFRKGGDKRQLVEASVSYQEQLVNALILDED